MLFAVIHPGQLYPLSCSSTCNDDKGLSLQYLESHPHSLLATFWQAVFIQLAVAMLQVMRWSDGSYLEDQDHWWLSGIHRDVFLLAKPLTFIADFQVQTPLVFPAKGSSRLSTARQVFMYTASSMRGKRVLSSMVTHLEIYMASCI